MPSTILFFQLIGNALFWLPLIYCIIAISFNYKEVINHSKIKSHYYIWTILYFIMFIIQWDILMYPI